ncbi:hypothetical protein FKM82_024988, partial [Ascaphus truei]
MWLLWAPVTSSLLLIWYLLHLPSWTPIPFTGYSARKELLGGEYKHASGPESSNDTVYRQTTKGLIEGVISGYNATVFAYGPTGCGKTYTMLGTDREPGIYIRTLNDLFKAIEETSDDMEYEVSMSYLE